MSHFIHFFFLNNYIIAKLNIPKPLLKSQSRSGRPFRMTLWHEGVVGIDNPTTYRFEQPDTTLVTIIVRDKFMEDLCKISATVYVGVCSLAPKVKQPSGGFPNSEAARGFQYTFSEWYHATNTSITDVGDVEISDPLFPGFVSKPKTVGETFTFVQGAGRRYRGLQSYFTSNGVFGPGITQNPQMRYNRRYHF